jgi:hypothetical protein
MGKNQWYNDHGEARGIDVINTYHSYENRFMDRAARPGGPCARLFSSVETMQEMLGDDLTEVVSESMVIRGDVDLARIKRATSRFNELNRPLRAIVWIESLETTESTQLTLRGYNRARHNSGRCEIEQVEII